MVLDLGSGPTSRFARELKDAGINATVIALSPDYATEKHAKKVKEANHTGHHVAAIGQELPFPNNTFDFVLVFHTYYHVPIGEENIFFNEAQRVLKPGGKLLIDEQSIEGVMRRYMPNA